MVASDLAPAQEFPLELRLGGVFGANTINYAMKGTGKIDLEAGRFEGSSLDFRGWAGGDPLPLAGVELTGALKQVTYEMRNGLATLDAGNFNLSRRVDRRLGCSSEEGSGDNPSCAGRH